ncbi:MAG: hypothetical protein KZQ94_01170 [Candidatus Thiodiazotropha sp. (ex Troendleina suluensis)]|nr:hypothetical protein [Candidatus Thiodiazotropha sp. (ex Troendleina suluensis)]
MTHTLNGLKTALPLVILAHTPRRPLQPSWPPMGLQKGERSLPLLEAGVETPVLGPKGQRIAPFGRHRRSPALARRAGGPGGSETPPGLGCQGHEGP